MNESKSKLIGYALGAALLVSGLFANSAHGANGDYISAIYQGMLGRSPSSSEISYWSGLLDNGKPRSYVSRSIYFSDEGRVYRLVRLFLYVLGRAIDSGGLSYWLNQEKGGRSEGEVEATFYALDEFYYAAGGNNALWVDALYRKLLGRPSDLNGRNFWTSQISSKGRAWVVSQIYNSEEACRFAINQIYGRYMGRNATSTELSIASNYADQSMRQELEPAIVSSAVCLLEGGDGCPLPPKPYVLLNTLGGTLESSDGIIFYYRAADPSQRYSVNNNINPTSISSSDLKTVLNLNYGNHSLTLTLMESGNKNAEDIYYWDNRNRITSVIGNSYSGVSLNTFSSSRTQAASYDNRDHLVALQTSYQLTQLPVPLITPTARTTNETWTYNAEAKVSRYQLSEMGPLNANMRTIITNFLYPDAFTQTGRTTDSTFPEKYIDRRWLRDSNGNLTQFTETNYDDNNKALTSLTQFTWYPKNNALVTPRNPNGQVVQTVNSIDPFGISRKEEYDVRGYLVSLQNFLGTTFLTRDPLGRINRITKLGKLVYEASYQSNIPGTKLSAYTIYGEQGVRTNYILNNDGSGTLTQLEADGSQTITLINASEAPVQTQYQDGTLLSIGETENTVRGVTGTVFSFNHP